MARFGSLKRLRAATVDEIAQVSGIGPRTAASIAAALHGADAPAAPAVNMTTGEVLDDTPAPSPAQDDDTRGSADQNERHDEHPTKSLRDSAGTAHDVSADAR
jgi:excinuclease ABC subunit C